MSDRLKQGTCLSLFDCFLNRPRTFNLRPRTLAMLALVSANIIWAASAVASKATLNHIPPLTMASLRVAIAFLVLRALLMRRHEQPATGASPALLGFTGVALFCACQNVGLLFADATTTALLSGSIPVLTAGLAVLILRERLGGPRLAGLLVSLLGVSLIVLRGSGQTAGAAALENLLPMASAVSFAMYAVFARRAFSQGSAVAMVTGSTRYGLVFLLPGAAFELTRDGFGPMTIQDGLLLLYLGAGCSALAFLLCGYGLAHLEAGQSAVYGNLKPLVGVVLAVVLLGEPLTVNEIGGGLLVMLGVGIASRQPGSNRGPNPITARMREEVAHRSTYRVTNRKANRTQEPVNTLV